MTLREELQNRADQLDAELLALSGRIRAMERESDDVHTCINALDIAEMDAQDAALEPAPAEQAAAKDTDDWQDNRRRFAHPTRFEDGPLGVSFNADDVIPDWLLLPDYVWTTQADGSVLVTPQAPALADPLSAELRSVTPATEEESGDQFEDEPSEFISDLTGDPAVEPESGLHGEPEPTELDAPASIVDDPELQAAVARAEQALAIDAQTCEPINPHPQPAYVGLQDPELDAEYEAMKEREHAERKKHFSIFGHRKLEEVS